MEIRFGLYRARILTCIPLRFLLLLARLFGLDCPDAVVEREAAESPAMVRPNLRTGAADSNMLTNRVRFMLVVAAECRNESDISAQSRQPFDV